MPETAGTVPIHPDDTVEALLSMHGTGAPRLHILLLALATVALVTAFLTHVDITVRSSGLLVPSVERQTLRSLTDGIVEQVHVTVGQHVSPGDTLVTIKPGAEAHVRSATLSTLQQQRLRAADLRMLIGVQLDTAITRRPPPHIVLERDRATLAEANVEWRQLSIQLQKTERIRDRLKELGRRGFAVPSELESAEFDVGRAHEERALTLERRRASWAGELADAEQQVVNLERDAAARATDQAARHVVASVRGTVEEMMPLSAGSVVRAGDPVAMISPDGTLVVDALVPPHDIAFLRAGMPARLIVEGYDVQVWGAVNARVASVASDYTVSDGHAVFRVRVRPLHADLIRADGVRVALRKGLRCQVRFTLGNQRLIDLLRRRVGDWLDPATPVASGASGASA